MSDCGVSRVTGCTELGFHEPLFSAAKLTRFHVPLFSAAKITRFHVPLFSAAKLTRFHVPLFSAAKLTRFHEPLFSRNIVKYGNNKALYGVKYYGGKYREIFS
jgi:hypothetical protein